MAELRPVVLATGGTGGTYYPLGGMLAQLISNKAVVDGKKITATAEAAGASAAAAGATASAANWPLPCN